VKDRDLILRAIEVLTDILQPERVMRLDTVKIIRDAMVECASKPVPPTEKEVSLESELKAERAASKRLLAELAHYRTGVPAVIEAAEEGVSGRALLTVLTLMERAAQAERDEIEEEP
jgi:hypothetical protein